jgi:hypothetical protein
MKQAKGVEIWTEADFVSACSGKKKGKGKAKVGACRYDSPPVKIVEPITT